MVGVVPGCLLAPGVAARFLAAQTPSRRSVSKLAFSGHRRCISGASQMLHSNRTVQPLARDGYVPAPRCQKQSVAERGLGSRRHPYKHP
jgi:hypothetical protein